jgi:hypothetical protein
VGNAVRSTGWPDGEIPGRRQLAAAEGIRHTGAHRAHLFGRDKAGNGPPWPVDQHRCAVRTAGQCGLDGDVLPCLGLLCPMESRQMPPELTE